MLDTINFDSQVPVYEQIKNQVIFAVNAGGLKSGDLNGVRTNFPGLLRYGVEGPACIRHREVFPYPESVLFS